VYEEYFGLSDAPFRLTPDPRFLYLSPKHAETLAHLRLGLTEPGGFVCITGDVGTGKTTVLRTFLADLGPEIATAYVFNPTLSWNELLLRIARELGVPTTGTSDVDLMDALNAHLLAERKSGRLSIAVIDEAQAVPLDVLERLRLLSNLETSTDKLLRLVLVGQPQLARLLVNPALAQLNQRITLRWHLGPLTRTETAAYVRHRLAVAGGERAMDLFTGPALALVHYYSGGVPRLVNMIAHRATLVTYVQRQRRVNAAAVRRAYREIGALPLPAQARAWRIGRTTAAIAAGAALLTIGMPRLEWPRAQSPEPPSVPPGATTAAVATAVPVVPAGALDAEAATALTDFERRVDRLDEGASLHDAVDAILSAWGVQRLRDDETPTVEALQPIASRRGLEALRLTGNLSMLRLLDLPALLVLRAPSTERPAYAVLRTVDDEGVTVAFGDETVRVAPDVLDRVWLGDAHLLWRDFEWLGPTFGAEASGTNVARLQTLLAHAGVYTGPASGAFDDATQAAVLDFQRSRRLDPDCRIGRLTRIALYGATGDYSTPTLRGTS
jgi:general secretion pathway protein A